MIWKLLLYKYENKNYTMILLKDPNPDKPEIPINQYR